MLYVRSASTYTGVSSDTRLRGMFQSCRAPVRRIGRALGRQGKFLLLSISLFLGEIVFNQSTESKGDPSGTATWEGCWIIGKELLRGAGVLRAYCLGSTDPLGFYLLVALKQPVTFSVTVSRACVQTHGVFPWEAWISWSNSVHWQMYRRVCTSS